MLGETDTISVAEARDIPGLVALRSSVARDMEQRFGEGGWAAIPREADVARQLAVSEVLVALREGRIVGTVRLARALPWAINTDDFTPVDTALYVLGLAVAPELQGQGIGRKLMDAAKDAARKAGAEALWLDAYGHIAGAGPFYLKCGFRQVGRTVYREMPLFYYEWLDTRQVDSRA